MPFDWKNPDYAEVYAQRFERLRRLRAEPAALPALRAWYAEHPADFIGDWGVTSDPRNANYSPPRPVLVPFVLFPRQREWVEWAMERFRGREPGLTEKSRDCGVSWLAMCLAATLCLLRPNLNIGVGSAKEDKIDRSGDPDSLLWKARTFIRHLPPEFRGSWDEARCSAHLRLSFPETGSSIVGEAGDNIGRGGRTSMFLVDEAAFLERPKLAEASLASNTDCRIDVSSVHGTDNPFAQKRHSGRVKVFTFHWRDDPRKDEEWYQRQRDSLDPVTLASEIDIDYKASVEGALIPSAWVSAAVGAHVKLGLRPSGVRVAGLDVADEGVDLNAIAGRHGVVLQHLTQWSGKGSDIYITTQRALGVCDEFGYTSLEYDADGLGAGVRGDAAQINEARRVAGQPEITVGAFRGSAAPDDPDGEMVRGRTNKDFFANMKAQAWWSLRQRFERTYRAVVHGMAVDPDSIISLDPGLPELAQLLAELSQPTYSINGAGKVLVDKKPDGARSPNLADAVMIAFNPASAAVWAHMWERLAG